MDTKPADCTCAYPVAIARNMCGHAPHCPAYQRWAQMIATPQPGRDAVTTERLVRLLAHPAFEARTGQRLFHDTGSRRDPSGTHT